MTARPLIVFVVVGFCSACSSATSPSPTPVPLAPPPTYTVSGTVVATNGGQALSGLSVDLNGQSATTNGAGTFSYALTSGSTSRLTLTGAGIVPRALSLNVGSARTVSIDAIGLGNGFDLGFYRQFVRNGFEGGNEPLRRWTKRPNVFIQTTDLVDSKTLEMVDTVARDAFPRWTNGLTVASVERGAGTPHVGQAGWITVAWSPDTARCGEADVGLEGGTITLFPKRTTCACEGFGIARVVVRHEFGHAAGFYHTDGAADLMAPSGWGCDAMPSARELAHAAIAYARPVGNLDPDADPSSAVTLAPMRVR